tara:strand:+ start:394 stop:843 length:450 start_codon:yes stop_codon:yes gene_type:complete
VVVAGILEAVALAGTARMFRAKALGAGLRQTFPLSLFRKPLLLPLVLEGLSFFQATTLCLGLPSRLVEGRAETLTLTTLARVARVVVLATTPALSKRVALGLRHKASLGATTGQRQARTLRAGVGALRLSAEPVVVAHQARAAMGLPHP